MLLKSLYNPFGWDGTEFLYILYQLYVVVTLVNFKHTYMSMSIHVASKVTLWGHGGGWWRTCDKDFEFVFYFAVSLN